MQEEKDLEGIVNDDDARRRELTASLSRFGQNKAHQRLGSSYPGFSFGSVLKAMDGASSAVMTVTSYVSSNNVDFLR